MPKNAPDWLQTTIVSTPNGTTSQALVAADIDHVLWAVNLGCLGFHVWPYLADHPQHADELRIDLDPSPGVEFSHIRQAAHEVHGLLDRTRHRRVRRRRPATAACTSTPGSSRAGTPTRCAPPPWRWPGKPERRRPDLVTAAWWKEERGARVFIDFNQNAPHKTVFGAWSVRARPGAQVSTPLAWEEIDDIHPDQFTIATLPARLESAGRPGGSR